MTHPDQPDVTEAEDRDAMDLTRPSQQTCCEIGPPSPYVGYACTRTDGHDGLHVAAGDYAQIYARWPKETPAT
jgi:hypothetical protein